MPFGHGLARLLFPEKTRRFDIEVEVVAEMTVINPFDFFVEEYAEHYPFGYDAQLAKELVPYTELAPSGPKLKAWLATVDRSEKAIVDFLVALNQRLWKDINYTVRLEPGIQTCEETLGLASGSCRDSAWLLVQIMRHLGLAPTRAGSLQAFWQEAVRRWAESGWMRTQAGGRDEPARA